MNTAPAINRRQTGFSLIELMVAMVLGLLLTLGVITFFQDSLLTSRTTISQGQMQDSALTALGIIKTDIRMAGFRGECVPQTTAPEENSALENFYAVAGTELNGANSDLLRLYTADIQEDNLFLWNHDRDNDELTLCANEPDSGDTCIAAEFETDDLLLVSDCEHWTVFYPNKASSKDEPNTKIQPGKNPDNSTPSLANFWLPGSDDNTNDPAVIQTGEAKGIIYRVGTGNDAGATVYQVVQNTNPDHVSNSGIQLNQLLRNGEPLLYGVEGLQVLYGREEGGRIKYREGCTDLEALNVHSCAKALDDPEKAPTTHLRISLIMQSDQRLGQQEAQNLQVADEDNNGVYQTASDGRIRQVYNTTVKIRNR